MKRGDVVTIALAGDFGAPRPAIIVESDRLAPTDHVIVCPGTSHVRPEVEQRRLHINPDAINGLKVPTQFQVDKVTVIRRSKCGQIIGRFDDAAVNRLNEVLALVLGLGD